MQSKISLLALALALAALALAAFRPAREPAAPPRADGRLRDLQVQVAELKQVVERLASRPGEAYDAAPRPVAPAPRPADTLSGARTRQASPPPEQQLQAMVEEAVSKKTREVVSELEAKKNKKPSMDLFAATLKLTKAQRHDTEQAVLRGQRETYRILEMPTDDGGNLMDELIDVAAKGVVWPGTDHGWGRWIAKVTTRKIPGTNETYAARIERVKDSVRTAIRRTLSKKQYTAFERWGVDPTEIKGVPDSPEKTLEQRVKERIEQLGEQFPDGPPK